MPLAWKLPLSTTPRAVPRSAGRSPLLRLQSDEKLVALIRRGHHGAFEALVQRYQPRLLAFCRHMLGSSEDAEDVLQEVFAASFNAICADERPINARPWLYRIARNRCLNHLRRPTPAGQDSMDIFERDGGTTTADTVHKREEFRQIVSDVQDLPETQRTALLLREIDALAYDQIAEAMDTTVPSVKSLLVRARVSLAEASEARLLTCEEVRLELGQVAEGLARTTAPVAPPPRGCERCRTFRSELRKTNKALAAIYPLGPLVFLKKSVCAKLGFASGAAAGAAAAWLRRPRAAPAWPRRRRHGRRGQPPAAHLRRPRHRRLQGRRGRGRRGDRHRGRRRGPARDRLPGRRHRARRGPGAPARAAPAVVPSARPRARGRGHGRAQGRGQAEPAPRPRLPPSPCARRAAGPPPAVPCPARQARARWCPPTPPVQEGESTTSATLDPAPGRRQPRR